METHANEHWENGRAPLIGRLYEVESLREIEGLNEREKVEPEDALQAPSKGRPMTPSRTAVLTASGSRPGAAAVFPFVDRITAYAPGVSITVQRTLRLDEDLHLADHTFVHAPGVKAVSACLPVVPLTMALEIMAETASCLAPGCGLIGFEDVTATRWIELADVSALELRIYAETCQFDSERKIHRIATAIYVDDQPASVIRSHVLFAPHYCLDISMRFAEREDVRPHPCSGEQIYEKRHLFHGPTYQLLTGPLLLHSRGITAHALLKAPDTLFKSTNTPQLLTDPTLLDTVGQLLGIWAMEQRDRQVFPIGMKKLEIYRPTPPAGTRVPLRIEITQEEAKTLCADVEIQDGTGSVWLRVKDWGAWKFRWPKRVTDFRRLPTRFPLSQQIELPGLPVTAVCSLIAPADVARFDATLLARFCLDIDEMRAFSEKRSFPRRQQHWLLGRIAAKDAARIWLARQAGSEEMLHPAAIPIESDRSGQPRVSGQTSGDGMPKLSIAHCDDGAIALAHSEAVGVDIEPIGQREPGFFETIATDAERRLLGGGGSSDVTDEWVTRVWCAKEAAGKLLSSAVNGSPRAYKILSVEPDGLFQVIHLASDRNIAVRTIRDHNLVIAYANDSMTAPDQLPE